MGAIYCRRVRSSGGIDENGQQTFHSEYKVKMDSPTATRTAVLLCGLLPVYGSPHPENLIAVCTGVQATRHPDVPRIWDAQADWRCVTDDRNPQDDQLQPDLRRPKWRSTFVPLPQSVFCDYAGWPFADRAGTPFSPPPQLPIYVERITVVRYEPTLDRAADRGFMNATNSDVWNGAAAYEAFCENIEFEEIYEFGQYWFLKTFTVLVNPFVALPGEKAIVYDPHNGNPAAKLGGFYPTLILNAGPKKRQWDQKQKKYVTLPIKTHNIPEGQPHPLDVDGQPVARNPNGTFAGPLVYLPFRTTKVVPFGPLNLVPPWVT